MAASNSFLVDENRTLKAENDDLRRYVDVDVVVSLVQSELTPQGE